MTNSNTILETNCLLIDKRLNSGLELISKHYDVSEFDVDTVLANPVIGNRPHHARHFDEPTEFLRHHSIQQEPSPVFY